MEYNHCMVINARFCSANFGCYRYLGILPIQVKIQPYLTSKMFNNNEVELLSKLRSKNIDVKCYFKTKFSPNNNLDKLKCSMKNCNELETQEHLIQCIPILTVLNEKYDKSGIRYDDIYSKHIKKQRSVTKLYKILIELRTKLLLKEEE